MIVDTSALIAIINEESEGDRFTDLILRASISRLSSASEVELAAVATRRKLFSIDAIRTLIAQLGLTIEAVTAEQARIGQEAYRKYGIGSGHEAALNFGDCFSYALAKAMAEPLLFKGHDFSKTDVRRAA